MIYEGTQQLEGPQMTGILKISKSKDGKFLAVMGKQSLSIATLLSLDIKIKDTALIEEDFIRTAGYNHWIRWTGANTLSIGTEKGTVLFYHIDNLGNIKSKAQWKFEEEITSFSDQFGHLVVATSRPALYYMSCDGNLVCTKTFAEDTPKRVRFIDIEDDRVVLTLNDGRIGHTRVEQSQIAESESVTLDYLEFDSMVHVRINQGELFMLNELGILTKTKLGNKEYGLKVLSEKCRQFVISHNGMYVFLVTDDYKLQIFNNRTIQTSTPIDIVPSDTVIIDAETDIYGYRLIVTDGQITHIVNMRVASNRPANLLFNAHNSVYLAPFNTIVPGPRDLIETDYPIIYSVLASDDSLMIATRHSLAYRLTGTYGWCILYLEKMDCKALWHQGNSFLCITRNTEDLTYDLAVVDHTKMEIESKTPIPGSFVNVDFFDDSIMVATTHAVLFYRLEGKTLFLEKKKVYNFKIVQAVILGAGGDGAVLSDQGKMLIVSGNEETDLVVTNILSSRIEPVLFFVANGQQYMRYEDKQVMIDKAGFAVSGISLFTCDNKIEKKNFLSSLLICYIDDPNKVSDLILKYIRNDGILNEITTFCLKAIDAGKLTKFIEAVRKLGNAKYHFLVVCLFEVDARSRDMLIKELPPVDELKAKFPDLAEQLDTICFRSRPMPRVL